MVTDRQTGAVAMILVLAALAIAAIVAHRAVQSVEGVRVEPHGIVAGTAGEAR